MYFSQKSKPGTRLGWSTVFKIDKLYNGEIGSYGNYAKIYHRRHEYELLFQVGDSYFVVADKQANGRLARTYLGYCGAGYNEHDILEYIETGNSGNFINRNCLDDLRFALGWDEKYTESLFMNSNCVQYVSTYKRKYPDRYKRGK